MNRNELLLKLKSIKGPLVALTAFADGITCEYITHKGYGFFELLDWSDLDSCDNELADEAWETIGDKELMDWVQRLESGEFSPIERPASSGEAPTR